MSIFGIGTDIVYIPRIHKIYQRFEDTFANKILSNNEKKTFFDIKAYNKKVKYLSKRFSAKESISKACGTGFNSHVRIKEIEVINLPNGKPFIQLLGSTEAFISRIMDGKYRLHVSISDHGDYAISHSILER